MKVMSLLSVSDLWFLNYRDDTCGVVCEVPSVGFQSFTGKCFNPLDRCLKECG